MTHRSSGDGGAGELFVRRGRARGVAVPGTARVTELAGRRVPRPDARRGARGHGAALRRELGAVPAGRRDRVVRPSPAADGGRPTGAGGAAYPHPAP
ncbi:hypothetical protein C1280_02890 [Gemmata obscuriglobus]|uniref:Uncharacterized protein n=1 Tax=Gemmata obscuriglobus TaxID=114 RepID=A0A2Z3GX30_9BACT|nr:hypothetical protein C1280_02890 [Gemmata obscuriglobus]